MPRLFHTLVVYGATATLAGCGGRATDSRTSEETPGGGGQPGGEGGAGASGGAGAPGGGGGGTAGSGAAGGGGMPALVIEGQWACDSEVTDCDLGELVLSVPCNVDPARPRALADCPDGTWFRCDRARLERTSMLVNCECVVPSPTATCLDCTGPLAGFPDECGTEEVTCSCYTGILR